MEGRSSPGKPFVNCHGDFTIFNFEDAGAILHISREKEKTERKFCGVRNMSCVFFVLGKGLVFNSLQLGEWEGNNGVCSTQMIRSLLPLDFAMVTEVEYCSVMVCVDCRGRYLGSLHVLK